MEMLAKEIVGREKFAFFLPWCTLVPSRLSCQASTVFYSIVMAPCLELHYTYIAGSVVYGLGLGPAAIIHGAMYIYFLNTKLQIYMFVLKICNYILRLFVGIVALPISDIWCQRSWIGQ